MAQKMRIFVSVPLLTMVVFSYIFNLEAQITKLHGCGKNHSQFLTQIIGGNLSHKGQWPWQVYLNKTIDYGFASVHFDCGASIIDENWILTAAHCVRDLDENAEHSGAKVTLEAVFGVVDLLTETGNQERRSIRKVIKHEAFDYDAFANDIAMLKLDSSLNLDAKSRIFLNSICLPNLSEEFYDDCYATGFGFQDKELKHNDHKLRNVPESLFDIDECRKHFANVDPQTNVCMGGVPNQGTCNGDSGSPLQCYHSTKKRWFQMGLVSYGQPCSLANIPDVFTRVAHYHDWISKQIQDG